MPKPLLSIGIIFKNEIRCLERCVKSLQALRDAVPCELVMADTGSDDGSRKIAEKYADKLIDFPWINDFSAARNAVLDRCTGAWYLSLDADEWLDTDSAQLVEFLLTPELNNRFDACSILLRNYTQENLEGDSSDFLAARMMRRSAGARYEGTIHEHWNKDFGLHYGITRPVIHHDGYVDFGGERGKAKRERNMQLLREKLKDSPNDLMLLLQCVESATGGEQEQYLRQAVAGVQEKRICWEQVGPPIYRYAVNIAQARSLPELGEWTKQAWEVFPDSLFIRIDVGYLQFNNHMAKKEYQQAIPLGEGYLQAVHDYRTRYDHAVDLTFSSLASASPFREEMLRILLTSAYFEEKQFEKAKDMLATIDGTAMSASNISNYVGNMMNLQAQSELDMGEIVIGFWEQISQPTPTKQSAKNRQAALYTVAAKAFLSSHQLAETQRGFKHAYTAFLPLKEKCCLGDAAAVLETENVDIIEKILNRQKNWGIFPIGALAYALKSGVRFPPPSNQLNIEEMDSLASRLAQAGDGFLPLALGTAERTDLEDWRGICWARGLLLAAVRTYPWISQEQDEEQGMALARAFAKIEHEFLTRCYTAAVLCEDGLFTLTPLHRFGWYCAQAFDALEHGSTVEYVRLLREGLDVCKGMKDMVEFLADHTAEVQQLLVPPELQALTNQVRVILARFDPNDPAVAALKQSEAYQKVAHLIEGMAVPVWGGLPQ